jgi:general secretion pathway protein B
MVQAPPVAPVAAAAVPPTPAERPIPLPPEPAVNDTPKPREKEDAPPPKAKKKAARVEKEKKAEEPVVKPAPPPMSSSDFLAVNDMPPQDAPSLTIGGYIYSAKPADRSVLINQRLVREGELVSPDLRIEEIARQGVIFSYRGQRFRKSY